jgi:sugar/nucleoside kinase (ribokinase family)
VANLPGLLLVLAKFTLAVSAGAGGGIGGGIGGAAGAMQAVSARPQVTKCSVVSRTGGSGFGDFIKRLLSKVYI